MAGLVYAHDLSIADRLVLKRLEDDIVRHGSGRTGDVDSDSDLAAGSATPSSLDSGSESPASTVFSAPIRHRGTNKTETGSVTSSGKSAQSNVLHKTL